MMDDIYIKAESLPRWLVDKHFKNKDIILLEDLIREFENISDELGYLQDNYEELLQDLRDNYKFIDTKEQIGYDERTW